MIQTRICIIKPVGPQVVQTHELARDPGYSILKKLIEPLLGGRLERVAVLADFEGGKDFAPLDMFVDDEFIAKGLLFNPVATDHYRRATMLGRSGAPRPRHPNDLPAIQGPAVLFDRRVWF